MDANDPLAAALGIDLGNPEERRSAELAYEDQHWLAALVGVRRASQLTQQEIAERMQTSQEAVSRLEKLGNDPRLSTIRRYALAVGVGYRHELVAEPIDNADHPRVDFGLTVFTSPFTSGSTAGISPKPVRTDDNPALVTLG